MVKPTKHVKYLSGGAVPPPDAPQIPTRPTVPIPVPAAPVPPPEIMGAFRQSINIINQITAIVETLVSENRRITGDMRDRFYRILDRSARDEIGTFMTNYPYLIPQGEVALQRIRRLKDQIRGMMGGN